MPKKASVQILIHIFRSPGQTNVLCFRFQHHPEIVEREAEYKKLLNEKHGGDITNFFLQAGEQCETFLSECSFDAFSKFPCCEVMKPVFDENDGLCHIFKGEDFRQSRSKGGLKLLISSNESLVVAGLHSGYPVGASVKIQATYDPTDEQQILVPPGYMLQLALQVVTLRTCPF